MLYESLVLKSKKAFHKPDFKAAKKSGLKLYISVRLGYGLPENSANLRLYINPSFNNPKASNTEPNTGIANLKYLLMKAAFK